MTGNFGHAYLVGSLLWGIPWVVIFLIRKDLQRQMLIMSLINSLYGFTEHFYYGEYWRPVFTFKLPGLNSSLDSILIMFLYGGLTAAFYKFCFRKRFVADPQPRKVDPRLVVIGVTLLGLLVFQLFRTFTTLNVIDPSILVCVLTGIGLVIYRRDLIGVAVWSMLAFGILSFIILIIFGLIYPNIYDAWWNIHALSGIRLIVGIPVEELLWHASIALAGPLLYEVWQGNKLESIEEPSKSAFTVYRTDRI